MQDSGYGKSGIVPPWALKACKGCAFYPASKALSASKASTISKALGGRQIATANKASTVNKVLRPTRRSAASKSSWPTRRLAASRFHDLALDRAQRATRKVQRIAQTPGPCSRAGRLCLGYIRFARYLRLSSGFRYAATSSRRAMAFS